MPWAGRQRGNQVTMYIPRESGWLFILSHIGGVSPRKGNDETPQPRPVFARQGPPKTLDHNKAISTHSGFDLDES